VIPSRVVGARADGDLPQSEEVVFAGSAHMMLYEEPGAVTTALLAFLACH
jgi:pimeloyl-ACP methyl ester carboxylesterase